MRIFNNRGGTSVVDVHATLEQALGSEDLWQKIYENATEFKSRHIKDLGKYVGDDMQALCNLIEKNKPVTFVLREVKK